MTEKTENPRTEKNTAMNGKKKRTYRKKNTSTSAPSPVVAVVDAKPHAKDMDGSSATSGGGHTKTKKLEKKKEKKETSDSAVTVIDSAPSSLVDAKPHAKGTDSSSVTSGVGGHTKTEKLKKKKQAKWKARSKKKKDPLNQTTDSRVVKEDSTGSDSEAETCIVCTNLVNYHAIGECNHSNICSLCSYRLRVVLKDKTCPICKHLEELVIVSSQVKPYSEFNVWGNQAGKDSRLDEKSGMLFIQCPDHFKKLLTLSGFSCNEPQCVNAPSCSNLGKLKHHYATDHGKYFCSLCVEHQHFFIQEQPLYTKKGLKAHEKTKKTPLGSECHPMCQFCHQRFFNDTMLYRHMEVEHFKCHLCDPQEQRYQYYRNYANLETHFRTSHYLCDQSECLQNRFIVFSTGAEYHTHMIQAHGMLVENAIQFRYRSNKQHDVDVQSSDTSSATPETWTFEQQPDMIPAPAQSTFTLSALAPTWSQHQPQVQREAEAFPSLSLSSASGSGASRPITEADPHPLSLLRNKKTAVPKPTSVNSSTSSSTRINTDQVVRNQRLANALGIADRGVQISTDESALYFERELPLPEYDPELQSWGKTKWHQLVTLERKITKMLDGGVNSISLRSMVRSERRMVHMLAEVYHLDSQAYDAEPHRYICLRKTSLSADPPVLLSQVVAQAGKKVSNRKADSVIPAGARARNEGTTFRGWEKVSTTAPNRGRVDAWDQEEGLVIQRTDTDLLNHPIPTAKQQVMDHSIVNSWDEILDEDPEVKPKSAERHM